MTFLEKITGSDITKEYKALDKEMIKLPEDYQKAWKDINVKLAKYSDFSGRNLIPILKSVLEMFKEMNQDNKKVEEIFGGNIDAFCDELTKGMISNDVRDKWRKKLNETIKNKLSK